MMKYALVIVLLLTHLGCTQISKSTPLYYDDIEGLLSVIIQKEGEIVQEYYAQGRS